MNLINEDSKINRNEWFKKIGYSVAIGIGVALSLLIVWFFYYPKIYGYLFPFGKHLDHFLLVFGLFTCFYLIVRFVKIDSAIFYFLAILPFLFLVPVKSWRANKLYDYWLDELERKTQESQKITKQTAKETLQILELNHETIDDDNDGLLDKLKLTVEISSKIDGDFTASALLGEKTSIKEGGSEKEFFSSFIKKKEKAFLSRGGNALSFDFPSKDIFYTYGSENFSFKIEVSFEPKASDLYFYSQTGPISAEKIFPLPYTRSDFLDKLIAVGQTHYKIQPTTLIKDHLQFGIYVTAKRGLYKMEGSLFTRDGEFLGRFTSQPYFIQSTPTQKSSAEVILDIPGGLIYRQGKHQQYTLKEVKIFDMCHEEIYLDVGGTTNSAGLEHEEFNPKVTTVESEDELFRCEGL